MRTLFGTDPLAWREAFLYEDWQENTWWVKSGQPRVPMILALRTPTHKLISYSDFEERTELFDLETEPDEMCYLA